jgi:protein-S-isoprenylcysteine O-methyltransferase Ste14
MEQKRKVVPPVYFLISLIFMTALYYLLPVVKVIPFPYAYAGILFIVFGLTIMLIAVAAFSRAKTPIIPFERSTALVVEGMYQFTRNPMYLGMVLVLTGAGVFFGVVSAFLPIPFFIRGITANFIRGEERFLEDIFGEVYVAYKQKVRRWV